MGPEIYFRFGILGWVWNFRFVKRMHHAGVRVGRTVPAFRKISPPHEKQSGGGGGGGDTETPPTRQRQRQRGGVPLPCLRRRFADLKRRLRRRFADLSGRKKIFEKLQIYVDILLTICYCIGVPMRGAKNRITCTGTRGRAANLEK